KPRAAARCCSISHGLSWPLRMAGITAIRSPDGVAVIMGLEQILVIGMFASFMVFLLLGFPVAWSLAGIGLLFAILGYVLVEYFDADLWFTWEGTIGVLDARIYGIVANELMVALPLFIFMGIMLDRSGIAERLMHSLVRVLGPLRGATRSPWCWWAFCLPLPPVSSAPRWRCSACYQSARCCRRTTTRAWPWAPPAPSAPWESLFRRASCWY